MENASSCRCIWPTVCDARRWIRLPARRRCPYPNQESVSCAYSRLSLCGIPVSHSPRLTSPSRMASEDSPSLRPMTSTRRSRSRVFRVSMLIRPSVKPPVGIEVCPVRHAYLLNGRFINAALTQQLFLRFFPDTPFPVLPSVVVCHSFFLQSELIERAEKSPLIFPKEKTRGLNALNFNFLLSFLVLLGFWLCVCLQRSGLCPTSPRLHARKVRQKRLPVSAPVHYPTAKAGRLSACPP